MSKRIIGRMLRGGWRRRGIAALAMGCLLAAGGWSALRWAPFPAARLAQYPAAVVLTDRRGEPLRVRLGVNDLDCRPSYVPAPGHWIVRALVAAEDQRYWAHPGLDGLALLRALRQNVSAGRRISGASTLSTQVIRLIQPRRRTLAAKVIEAFRALQMEQRYSKLDILAQYLNRAPFGGNIVGIEAAAWRYFGKQAADLSLAEAALLAGLPQAPSRLRPDRHPAAARARQAYVLERMQVRGDISAEESRWALAQPLAIRRAHYPFRAPHFTDWAGVPPGLPPGAPAVTTLDPDWQRLAEEVLERQLAGRSITGGAIVLLDVRTGAVRALAGSPDYAAPDGGQYNAALAARSAGSTLKPFVYALALDQGRISPHSMLRDVPRHYRDYDPTNFDPVFRGVVSVREALVLSLNLPAIEVQDRIGQPRFLQTLRRLGFRTLFRPAAHYGTGLVLGNGEVRLLDLVNAYACLARGGAYLPVRAFEALPPPSPQRLFSPEACWLIAELLSGDERALDATGHAADVRLPRLAWKTGTSAGRRDAWTVAYNPEVVIGVWVGNLDGARSDWLVGRQAATPMVWDIFRRLYPDNQGPWFARPPGIEARAVCAVSGRMPGPHCPHQIQDWWIAGVTRPVLCASHRQAAHPDGSVAAASPALVPGRPALAAPPASVRITSPAPDSTFRRLSGLQPDTQQLALNAVSDGPGEPLHWFVNDRYLGAVANGETLFWPLERGTHQIVCSTGHGAADRVRIAVE